MFTWRKWWLLFAALWGVIAALQVFTILAFSPEERDKALQPALYGIGVPAVLYLVGLIYERLTSRRPPPKAK